MRTAAIVRLVVRAEVVRLVVKLGPIAVALLSCAGQLAQLPAQAEACAQGVVPGEAAAVLQQAYASATSAPGAPTWNDFAKGQLLSQGISVALCIGEALLHDLDQKLPATAVADASGRVVPMVAHVQLDAPSCPDPKLLLAHDRAVDFLERHGVKHHHATPAPHG